jgi:hypothetical protein
MEDKLNNVKIVPIGTGISSKDSSVLSKTKQIGWSEENLSIKEKPV